MSRSAGVVAERLDGALVELGRHENGLGLLAAGEDDAGPEQAHAVDHFGEVGAGVRDPHALLGAVHRLSHADQGTCPPYITSRLECISVGLYSSSVINDLPEALAASISSSLQHASNLLRKQRTLAAATEETFVQLIHRIGAAHRAGDITDDQLCDVLAAMRAVSYQPLGRLWNDVIDISWQKLAYRITQRPNGPEGTWVGEYPFPQGSIAPPTDVPVVYVLFDDHNEPVYVGSTHNFRDRMRDHRKDGKRFVRWQAYPCNDREAAYQLEERLLREHLPSLNRKTGR